MYIKNSLLALYDCVFNTKTGCDPNYMEQVIYIIANQCQPYIDNRNIDNILFNDEIPTCIISMIFFIYV